jgi:hypothetical protein
MEEGPTIQVPKENNDERKNKKNTKMSKQYQNRRKRSKRYTNTQIHDR